MLKKETSVSKMEANQFIEIIGIAKKSNHLLLKTKSGKVTYQVSEGNPHIFENSKYQEIFKQLKDAESKLVEPLDFSVGINFMILEALKTHLSDEELNNIYESMGTGMFMLINDLSNRYTNLNPEEIADKYLSPSQIANFRDFYSKHYELVVETFKNGYSSIPLYEMLYNKKGFHDCITNIRKHIESNVNSETILPITKLVYKIVIEFENEIRRLTSEDEIEDLYYAIRDIDKNLDKITDEVIECLPNYSILAVHSLLFA